MARCRSNNFLKTLTTLKSEGVRFPPVGPNTAKYHPPELPAQGEGQKRGGDDDVHSFLAQLLPGMSPPGGRRQHNHGHSATTHDSSGRGAGRNSAPSATPSSSGPKSREYQRILELGNKVRKKCFPIAAITIRFLLEVSWFTYIVVVTVYTENISRYLYVYMCISISI